MLDVGYDAAPEGPPPGPDDAAGEAPLARPKWDVIDAAAVVCLDASAMGLGAWLARVAGRDDWAGAASGVSRLVVVLPAVLLVSRRHWKAAPAELGVRPPRPGSWKWSVTFAAVLAGSYAALAVVLAFAYRGEAARLSAGAGYWLRDVGLASWCFRAFVAAPVVEELVFRGVLHGAIRGRTGAKGAALLSAAMFAAMHPVWAWRLFLPWTQFLGGLVFAWSYEKTRSLVHPVAFHVIGNAGVLSVNLVLALRPGWVEAVLG